MNTKGPKLGWLLGGIGGLLWLAAFAVLWAVQGRWLGGIAAAAVFVGGVCYLFALAPWKYPRTQLRLLYLGFLGFVLVGVAVAYGQFVEPENLAGRHFLPLIALLSLAIPFFTLGRKRWGDLHSSPAEPPTDS